MFIRTKNCITISFFLIICLYFQDICSIKRIFDEEITPYSESDNFNLKLLKEDLILYQPQNIHRLTNHHKFDNNRFELIYFNNQKSPECLNIEHEIQMFQKTKHSKELIIHQVNCTNSKLMCQKHQVNDCQLSLIYYEMNRFEKIISNWKNFTVSEWLNLINLLLKLSVIETVQDFHQFRWKTGLNILISYQYPNISKNAMNRLIQLINDYDHFGILRMKNETDFKNVKNIYFRLKSGISIIKNCSFNSQLMLSLDFNNFLLLIFLIYGIFYILSKKIFPNRYFNNFTCKIISHFICFCSLVIFYCKFFYSIYDNQIVYMNIFGYQFSILYFVLIFLYFALFVIFLDNIFTDYYIILFVKICMLPIIFLYFEIVFIFFSICFLILCTFPPIFSLLKSQIWKIIHFDYYRKREKALCCLFEIFDSMKMEYFSDEQMYELVDTINPTRIIKAYKNGKKQKKYISRLLRRQLETFFKIEILSKYHILAQKYVSWTDRLNDVCSICMESLTTKECFKFECSHILHQECTYTYLKYNMLNCPLCSKSLMA